MRRLLLISLATIPLAGCQFFNRDKDVAVIDLVEAVESGEMLDGPPTIPALAGDTSPADGSEAFADPTVESKGTGTVSADLIRSTDPAARTRQVERSRLDPFASLPIPPTPEPVVVPVAASNNGGRGASASNASGGRAARNVSASASASGGGSAATVVRSRPAPTPPPVRVQPNNTPLVTPSPIAALPPIPQPVIAPTVSVSGVIQLGNEPYAILRSGSEPERYVRVGDRIAGGAVRVKRIETLAFEPRVILEENGIEVSRPISADAQTPTETPAVSVPEPVASGSTPAAVAGVAPVAAIPVIAPASPLPVPAAAVPNTQAVLPGMTLPAPTNALTPAPGVVPSSLLLQPAESTSQAVLPNFRVSGMS